MKHANFLPVLLAVAFAASAAIPAARAATETVDGVTWTYTVTGSIAKVTGASPASGNLAIPATLGGYPVADIGSFAFARCTGLANVAIPDSVISIGSSAFLECSNLVSVAFGNGVTDIGSRAFLYSKLASVTIPAGVTKLEEWVFGWCTNLTSVTIPDSVTDIGSRAFYGCGALERVELPGGVTNIGDSAFAHCYSLANMVIPAGVTSIADNMFLMSTNLACVTMPDGVTNIGHSAFASCRLANVAIPSNVTSIGKSAFSACCFTNVTIPDKLTSIENGLFSYCHGLESVTIPDGVTNIGKDAFADCRGLKEVHVSDLETWCGITFGNDAANPLSSAHHLFVDGEEVRDLVIPGSVTEIGISAFAGCTGLVSVAFHDNVASVKSNAFANCSGLAAVHIHDLAAWCGIVFGNSDGNPLSRAGHLFLDGEEVTDLVIPAGVEKLKFGTFYGWTGLKTVTIPDGVTSIGKSTFYGCANLVSVAMPDSVANIGIYAFASCSNLASMALSGNLASIGNYVFQNCSGLTNVAIPGSVTNIGSYAFSGCSKLANVTLPGNLENIGDYAFQNCSELASVVIPDNVTNIGIFAFYHCQCLQDVTIPGSVARIGYYAFSSCYGLTNATIAHGVAIIGESMFHGCTSLSSVTLPDGLTSIGTQAFYSCRNLMRVEIPNSVTNIGIEAFRYCHSLKRVTLPDSLKSIGNNAFSDCGNLKQVHISDLEAWCGISFANSLANPLALAHHLFLDGKEVFDLVVPDTMTGLKDYAFYGCSGLTSVTIPDSVTKIGNSAFQNCSGLTRIVIPDSVASVGSSAFFGCGGLATVVLSGDVFSGAANFLNLSSIERVFYSQRYAQNWAGIFEQCGIEERILLELVDFDIREETAEGKTWKYYLEDGRAILCSGDWAPAVSPVEEGETLAVPPQLGGCPVTGIGFAAFLDLPISGVELPATLTDIADYAFYECVGLASAAIPSSVQSIGSHAFAYCASLQAVRFAMPSSLVRIGDRTFLQCWRLGATGADFALPASVEEIGTDALAFSLPRILAGTINTSTHLKSGVVYMASNGVTVASGATLTIHPGAILKFGAGASLLVNGTLESHGTRASPIVFTSLKDDGNGGDTNGDGGDTIPQPGDWHQISGSGTVGMEHCRLLWCSAQNNQGGLFPRGGTWTFNDSTVAHCEYDCMRGAGGTFSATNSIFADSSMGAAPQSGTARFVNCVFHDLTTAVRWGNGTFVNCIFADISQDIIDTRFYSSTLNSQFSHCCFWNPESTGDHASAKAGQDGNVYADPLFANPENGDYRLSSASSPCIDAGDGAIAPDSDHYGRPRMDVPTAADTGTPSANGAVPDIGIFEYLGDIPLPAPDLEITAVSVAPAALTVGGTAEVSWTVQNVGEGLTAGTWRDEVELVAANGQIHPMGTATARGAIPPGETASFIATVAVPTAPEGPVRIRVTANKHQDLFEGRATANNAGETAATLRSPALAVPADGSSVPVPVAPDAPVGFSLSVPGGAAAVLLLRCGGDIDAWLGNGSLAAKDNAVRTAVQVADGLWLLQIPAGTLPRVTIANDGDATVSPALSLQTGDFFLLDTGMMSAANSGTVTVPFAGNGFGGSMSCWLEKNGTKVFPSDLAIESGVSARATFDMAGCAAGDWTLHVRKGASEASATLVTLSESRIGAKWTGETDIPSSIRSGRTYVGTFRYGNGGDTAMPAPYVRLTATGPTLIRLSEADAWAKSVEFFAASDTYPASSLKPGDSSKVSFFYKTTGTSAEIEYGYTLSSDKVFPWKEAESEMRPSWATDELWGFAFATLRANFGETWNGYLDRLRADCDHLMKIGSPTKRVDRLLQLELNDALGIDMAVPTLAAALDLARGGRGLGLSFSRAYASSLHDRFAKGVLGYGWTDNFSSYAELADEETLVFHLPSGGACSFTKVSGAWQPGDARDRTVLEETPSSYVLACRDGTVLTVAKSNMRTASIRDNRGNSLSFAYNGTLLSEVRHSDGQTLSFTHSGDKLAKISDDQGRKVSYGYTGELLTSVTNFDGLVTRYEYHAADGTPCARALERIVYPDGTTKEYAYDARGRVASVSVNGGKLQTRISRGACGSFSVIAPDGGVTEVTVGADGETLKAVDALGQTLRQTYTGDALLETITAPSGKRSRIVWDKDGLPVSASSASGATTAFSFEPDFGNLASVTDAKGHAFSYGYDGLGRGTSVVHADGSAATVEYNARGDVAKTTNRRGESIAFEYDAEGRMTKKTWEDGRTFSFAYDAKGNVTNAADSATGVVTMEYDDAERLVRMEYPKGRGFTFAYDAAGRLAERASLDGTVERFAYDAFGRLAGVTDGSGNVWLTNAYDATTGWLVTQTYGNGVVVSNAYDLLGRTVGISHLKDGVRIAFFEYAYDEDGHCVSQTTAEGVERYTYDADGQLTGVTYPDGTSEKFSYDAVGNRIGYDVNELNQYLSGNGATFTYDADGNMTSRTDVDGTTLYAYDTLNRLIAVTNEAKGIRWSCEYDVFGNRTSVTDNGVTTEKLYLQGTLPSIAAEYVNGSLSKRHVLVGSVRLADVVRTPTAAQTRYYHGDLIGSVRLLTDGTGAAKGTRSFKAFGETRVTSGETTDAGYVGTLGVETDVNGLRFMRNRYYDAEMGRFVQMDPIGSYGRDENLYRYCCNSPLEATDVFGTYPSFYDTLLDYNRQRDAICNTPGPETLQDMLDSIRNDDGKRFRELNWLQSVLHKIGAWHNRKFVNDMGCEHVYGKDGRLIKNGINRGTNNHCSEKDGICHLEKDMLPWFLIDIPDSLGIPREIVRPLVNCTLGVGDRLGYLIGKAEILLKKAIQALVKQSCDPNEISGPSGTGDERYVNPGQWMDYIIYFENKTNATAAAQEIAIDLPMDDSLDWNTLELGEIVFGGNIVTNLAGKKHGQAEFPLPGRNDSVKMEVKTKDGVLRWYLRSWDPATFDNFPADAEGGFLPPNDPETHCGEGRVTYRVKVKAAAAEGARIDASATIVFDNNDPIATDPAWWNTVAWRSYGVRFNANGGKGSMAEQRIQRDVATKLSANKFTRSGHTFIGWNKSKAGGVAYGNAANVKNLAAAGGSVTLYAQWAKNKYSVKYNANGGALPKGKTMAAQALTYGKAAKLRKNAFTRKDCVFIGWATSKSGKMAYKNAQAVKNLRTDGKTTTLYAKWAKKTYTVAFNANGGKGTMAKQKMAYGKAAKLRKNAFTKKDSVFLGWATSKNGKVVYKNAQAVKNLRTDGKTTTLHAKWAKKTYKVAFQTNGGTGKMAVQTLTWGKAARLSANQFARKGWTFAGWSRTAGGAKAYGDKQSVKNLVADGSTVKLYALWKANGGAKDVQADGGDGEGTDFVPTMAADEPWVVVTTSDKSDGLAVADGDEGTAWSPETADGSWVVLSFADAVDVSDVEVAGENLPEGTRILISEDADDWQEGVPGAARYVWVLFPASEEPPVVREIRVEE